jgi:hemimethylated DNA binding protein
MLVRTLFRQLTKKGSKLEACATAKNLSIIKETSNFDTLEYTPSIEKDEQITSYIRREFDAFASFTSPEDIQISIDLAFKALRQAEQRISELENSHWKPRPENVFFRVGQIVRHKKYGYRAVIRGWDTSCRQSQTWKRRMRIHTLEHAGNQPFYDLLVDSRTDSNRERTYAAQENLQDESETNELLENFQEEQDEHEQQQQQQVNMGNNGGPTEHPEIEKYFESFSFRDAKYRPTEELRQMYPED